MADTERIRSLQGGLEHHRQKLAQATDPKTRAFHQRQVNDHLKDLKGLSSPAAAPPATRNPASVKKPAPAKKTPTAQPAARQPAPAHPPEPRPLPPPGPMFSHGVNTPAPAKKTTAKTPLAAGPTFEQQSAAVHKDALRAEQLKVARNRAHVSEMNALAATARAAKTVQRAANASGKSSTRAEAPAVVHPALVEAEHHKANRAEISREHGAARVAVADSISAEAKLAATHGKDSPEYHAQQAITARLRPAVRMHSQRMRAETALEQDARARHAESVASTPEARELAQERARGARARADAANIVTAVDTHGANTAHHRAQLVAKATNPAIKQAQTEAEGHRRQKLATDLRMGAVQKEIAVHHGNIARLTHQHGPDSPEVLAERGHVARKTAAVTLLHSEADRHAANAAAAEARAAHAAGDERAPRLHATAQVLHQAADTHEENARTAAFKAENPVEHAGNPERALAQRREHIKKASESFHGLLRTGSKELIGHLHREVGA